MSWSQQISGPLWNLPLKDSQKELIETFFFFAFEKHNLLTVEMS